MLWFQIIFVGLIVIGDTIEISAMLTIYLLKREDVKVGVPVRRKEWTRGFFKLPLFHNL